MVDTPEGFLMLMLKIGLAVMAFAGIGLAAQERRLWLPRVVNWIRLRRLGGSVEALAWDVKARAAERKALEAAQAGDVELVRRHRAAMHEMMMKRDAATTGRLSEVSDGR